jgi:tetratricopeptide (TPR) repeat protein
MRVFIRWKRATIAVCAASVVGCASATPQRDAVRSAPAKIPPADAPLRLNDEQIRRAQALAHYGAGVLAELNRDVETALKEYLAVIELDPSHVTLSVRIASEYLRRKEFDRAAQILQTAAKNNPRAADPRVWLGIAHRANDQLDLAIPPLREALNLEPTNLFAVQTLAEVYLLQNKQEDAAKVLLAAAKQKSDDAVYWARLGDLIATALKQKPTLIKFIEPDEALTAFEKARQLSPDDPDVLMRLGDSYAMNKDTKRAIEAYARLLELRPNANGVREKLALSYVAEGDKEKAVAVLEEIIRREPLRFEIYNWLGELNEELKRDEKAVSYYKQSLVLNPNQLFPCLRASLILMRLKKHGEAVELLDAARDKFPFEFRVPYFLGLAYSDDKQYEKAIPQFELAEELAKDSRDESLDSTFYFYFGAANERTGNIERAAELFRRSIELNPENAEALNYLGYMWADNDINLEEAHDLIKRAVARDPDNGAFIDSLGWVLFKMGNIDQALTELKRAAQIVTDDATIFDHLAEVYLKLGNTNEAIAQWKKALEIEPDNKEIAEKLQSLLEKTEP